MKPKNQTQAIIAMLIRGWTSTKMVSEQIGCNNFHARRDDICRTYRVYAWKERVFFAGQHYRWQCRDRKTVNRYGKRVTVRDWRLMKV